jgi:hypothetical protein
MGGLNAQKPWRLDEVGMASSCEKRLQGESIIEDQEDT